MQSLRKRFLYLLTVWQERASSPNEPATWRFSLEDARTGERYGFANPKQLQIFLEDQMKRLSDPSKQK